MYHKLPVKDIIEWDVLNWSELLKYWDPILRKLPHNARVLAVGERNGGLTLMFALLGFEVTCTDRKSDFAQAKLLHQKYRVTHLVQYAELDIVNDKVESGVYDVVVAKSVIGGLKLDAGDSSTRNFTVQQSAVKNIYTILKPGGYFLSAENLTGPYVISLIRTLRNKNKGWRYLHYKELKELLSIFSSHTINTFGVLPTSFPGNFFNTICYTFNRYIFRILPPEIHYIGFSIAGK